MECSALFSLKKKTDNAHSVNQALFFSENKNKYSRLPFTSIMHVALRLSVRKCKSPWISLHLIPIPLPNICIPYLT